MQDWSAQQYLLFEAERSRPAIDLVNRVPPRPRGLIVDLGCGPGNSTRLLVERFPSSEVIGVDTSIDMLTTARTELPGVQFALASAATWRPTAPANLIFANAVMQWVPRHIEVLKELAAALAPDGALAVQMPDNYDEPSHILMREVASRPRYRYKLARVGASREPIGQLQDYFEALSLLCPSVDIWRTTYLHRLSSPGAIVEWVKGTGLRPYLAALTASERDDFLFQYSAEIAHAYPPRANGEALLPFPRLFIVAER